MTAPLTVEALLGRGIRRLAQIAVPAPNPGFDAQLLLAHALCTSRTQAMMHPERLADTAQAGRYETLIERRAAGEPLAYILESKEFWSLALKVGPAVLVPRPETELLVERALALHAHPAGRIADLGTGSGAIALALAAERPGWTLVATDISAAALGVARANAVALDLQRIEFLQGSWFAPLRARTFDLVVSNPPYVAADDPAMDDPALKHEPRMALTPGPDALACLREIARSAPEYLERAISRKHANASGPGVSAMRGSCFRAGSSIAGSSAAT